MNEQVQQMATKVATDAASQVMSSGTMEKVSNAAIDAASGVSATAGKVAASSGEMLQGLMLKALQKTGNAIEQSVDMVMEQAPLVVQEVLHWYFAYNLIMCLFGVIVFLILIWFNKKQWNWFCVQSKLPRADTSEMYDNWSSGLAIINIVQIFPIIYGLSLINLVWLKIYIAPRLWLIEYTAELIKNAAH